MWKFVGTPGQFLPGVPARDLTDEEAKAYPEVKESAIYERVRPATTKAGAKKEGK